LFHRIDSFDTRHGRAEHYRDRSLCRREFVLHGLSPDLHLYYNNRLPPGHGARKARDHLTRARSLPSMNRHSERLIKSIRTFGVRNGIAVFWPYLTHRLIAAWRWRPRTLSIRGIAAPLSLRPGVSDWIVLERIFMDQEYHPVSAPHEAAIRAVYETLVAQRKIPLIIDCGANIGMSAIWFAREFPRATVLAIEPEPGNFAILRDNAARFPGIVPIQAAISDRVGRVTLTTSDQVPWAWRTRETAAAADAAMNAPEAVAGEVETVTIPDLIARQQDQGLLIVKVDIEGAETSLLRSNTGWLAETPLVIFEMHDWMSAWCGSGHAFFSKLTLQCRDYLIRGENIFAYSHAALRTAGQATSAADPASPGIAKPGIAENIFADDAARAG
jgi:FkbM family methyltransferase